MTDPVPIPQSWLVYAGGALFALFGGIFAYFRHKVDRLEERVNLCITREELAAIELRIEARAASAEARTGTMHSENTSNFRELRVQLEGVNSKLFDLASKK